jgi:adenylate cyclase
MSEERVQRRLAAIMAADAVGYSRMMGRDEAGTLARLKSLRSEFLHPKVAEYGGRIVKTTGDGTLIEFPSAVDAVSNAVDVQRGMAVRNASLPEDQQIQIRIGINVGDIIVDHEDIYGDGVNVAARLESIAEPGGICVSSIVNESVGNRVDVAFTDGGEVRVKNIDRLIRVWKWRPDADPSSNQPGPKTAAPALPDKPSLAVLPFTNMSGDPEQEYFADGIAEDIITELSRLPWFFVIARNSSFSFKGKAVDVKKIGAELGVAYVLEGSVRKAGNRLRINAQLIDAATGNHVWAARYDREIADIFDIQDKINQAIIGAVAPEFVSAELKRTRQKDPADLSAWECVMRGRAHVWKFGREDSLIARRLFEQAMTLSPKSGLGASDLALVYFLDAFYGWGQSREQSLKDMIATAEKSAAADETDPLALTILAWSYLFALKWDLALATIDRAIALSPNFAPAIGIRGTILACADEIDAGIAAIEEAMRRSPRDGFMPFWLMGLYWAYHCLQDYEKAAATAQHSIRIAPENPTFRRQMAVAMHMLNCPDESKAALAEYLKLSPNATLDDARAIPSRNRTHVERFVDALKQMGVPESAN